MVWLTTLHFKRECCWRIDCLFWETSKMVFFCQIKKVGINIGKLYKSEKKLCWKIQKKLMFCLFLRTYWTLVLSTSFFDIIVNNIKPLPSIEKLLMCNICPFKGYHEARDVEASIITPSSEYLFKLPPMSSVFTWEMLALIKAMKLLNASCREQLYCCVRLAQRIEITWSYCQ